jgi:hypothetical protein
MNQSAGLENRKGRDEWRVMSDEQDCGFRMVSIENPKSKIQNGSMTR